MQLVEPRNMPPAPLTGSTLRQVFRITISGSRVRMRLSNIFSNGPITVASARLARSAGMGVIDPAYGDPAIVGGDNSVPPAPGAAAVSDPLTFDAPALTRLTVSLFIPSAPSEVTGHPGARTTSYLQAGNVVRATAMPDAARAERWYVIAGLEVVANDNPRVVIALGNSITDGRGSGTDRDTRWTDYLANRLAGDPRTRRVVTLNAGLGGNKVLAGGLGPTALVRLDRDVLDVPGARWLIVKEGVNDLGEARAPGSAAQVAQDLIAAFQQIITRAHARGLRVYGATILPFEGSQYGNAEQEAARQAVNAWIRTSGAYDAVIDFDAALRDPGHPSRLLPSADTGDHLHPNEAGYRMMAEMIDLVLFTR